MTRELRMDAPAERRFLDETRQGVLGLPLPRPEGPLKVTGRATYAAEYDLPGLAHGVLVRATIRRGRVTAVHGEAAKAQPGVLDVITDARLLRNPAQGTAAAAPVQGPDRVSYLGQPIALVVAETFEQARHVAQDLVIEYAPEADGAASPDDPAAPVERRDHSALEQGDLEGAMDEAAVRVDRTYTTPSQNSAAMEPHAATAAWEGHELTLYGACQMLNFNIDELADAVGVAPDNVRIVSAYVGGGFGSKLGIAPEAVAAALAARALDRPVRVVMPRQQVFEATMRRTETRQRIRLGADSRGVLTALAHESRVSNLPDEAFSEPVEQSTHFLYGGGNRRLAREVARVDRTCAGSMRAPGEAVGMLALECAMDELAEATGIDPVELRKRNLPERHPETDVPYSSRPLVECLDEGARRFGWDDRPRGPRGRREGEWWIGCGMAAAARANLTMEARARVILRPGGTARVETDLTDIGTGSYAVLAQIAAEMLGLPTDRVEVGLGDTRFPRGSGSGGSVGASSTGSAVYLACEEIRERIATALGCAPDVLRLEDGIARHGDSSVSLGEFVGEGPIEAEGHFLPGETSKAAAQATYGAQFCEVAVSAVTGETRVRRMLGVFAAGRILNEQTARSQCIGGMVFGIGAALTEALVHDPRDGHVVNRDLAEYHLPVNLDVPQLEVVLVEERDEWGCPMQSKGIGELGICGSGAAILNAIHDACGVRVRDYPATLDKVLTGLDG